VLPWLEATEGQVIQFGLRAADVLLATAQPREISAQNVLSGTVQAVRQQDGELYVEVDCGVSITASVTQRAVASLALRQGREVWVVVKATSFFLVDGS
jgi:molybdate transport system ATP-binding protein